MSLVSTLAKPAPDPEYHIDIKKLGSGYWDISHRISGDVKTPSERLRALMFTQYLVAKFPCLECREHIQAYEKRHPLNLVVPVYDSEGRDLSLFKWWWQLHNEVNERKKYPLFDWEDALTMYTKDSVCALACTGKDTKTVDETEHVKDSTQYLSAI